MKSVIETKLSAQYLPPNFLDFLGSWSNDNQKGAGGKFTCVGLIEWAAEQAGHNGGQGFVPDELEEIDLTDKPGATVLLSPELMHFCASNPTACFVGAFLKGLFDPVDYILTDPLGRRLGYTEATGPLDEIPGALRTPNGVLEQVLIPAAVPGVYSVSYTGVGGEVRGGFSIVSPGSGETEEVKTFSGFLEEGQQIESALQAPSLPGARGDVSIDGVIDENDLILLQQEVGRFADGLYDPFDINGDGSIDQQDVDLLNLLIEAQGATLSPTAAPTATPTEVAVECNLFTSFLQIILGWLVGFFFDFKFCDL